MNKNPALAFKKPKFYKNVLFIVSLVALIVAIFAINAIYSHYKATDNNDLKKQAQSFNIPAEWVWQSGTDQGAVVDGSTWDKFTCWIDKNNTCPAYFGSTYTINQDLSNDATAKKIINDFVASTGYANDLPDILCTYIESDYSCHVIIIKDKISLYVETYSTNTAPLEVSNGPLNTLTYKLEKILPIYNATYQ
jgi:hypothetical protein